MLTGTTNSSDLAEHWKDMNPDDVWLGDSPEGDWDRLRHFMRAFGRDGRKLEVWRLWLGYYHPEHKDKFTDVDLKGNRREKQWTEDDGPLESEVVGLEIFSKESVSLAPRDFMVAVLRKYVRCSAPIASHSLSHLVQGQKILRSFIYPDSRAQFLKLLALSGLLRDMDIPLSSTLDVMTEIDFWSYAETLQQEGNVTNSPVVLTPSVKAQQQRESKILDARHKRLCAAP